MQQTTITKNNEPSIEAQIEAAKTKLATLLDIASEAEAEAQRWETTFEREPTEQAFSARAVTRQKAQNARAAAVAFERDTLNRLVGERSKLEREAITRQIDAQESAIRARFNEAMSLIVQGLQELDGSIADLAGFHGARLDAQRAGAVVHPLSLAGIVRELSAKLAPFDASSMHQRQHTSASITVGGEMGAGCCVRLEISRPAGAVPSPLR